MEAWKAMECMDLDGRVCMVYGAAPIELGRGGTDWHSRLFRSSSS